MVDPAVLSAEDAIRLCVRTAALGWHLQLQLVLNAANAALLPSLMRNIEVPLVIDHLGRVPPHGDMRPLLAALDTGRAWVKLSAPDRASAPSPPHEDLAVHVAALLAARADRLLWGSDWRHTGQATSTPQPGALADLLHTWTECGHAAAGAGRPPGAALRLLSASPPFNCFRRPTHDHAPPPRCHRRHRHALTS